MLIKEITKIRKYKITKTLNNLCIGCLDYKHNHYIHKNNNVRNLYCKKCSNNIYYINNNKKKAYACCPECSCKLWNVSFFFIKLSNPNLNRLTTKPSICIECFKDDLVKFYKNYKKNYEIYIEKRNQYIITLLMEYNKNKNNNNITTTKNTPIYKYKEHFNSKQFKLIGNETLEYFSNYEIVTKDFATFTWLKSCNFIDNDDEFFKNYYKKTNIKYYYDSCKFENKNL